MSLYRQGKVPGSFYDGYGQEAVSAGAAFAMAPEDRLCILHRDLAAHIVRGVAPGAHPGPVHGPRHRHHRAGATATCTSATATSAASGMVSMLPDMMLVATGMAMAFKLRGERRCAITWFGDGSTSRGDFHEAMNWAARPEAAGHLRAREQPVRVLDPAGQAVRRRPGRARRRVRHARRDRRRQRRRGDVRGHARGPRARAVAGEGPTLIEAVTMRMHGHAAHDDMKYVPKEQVEEWRKRDPIDRQDRPGCASSASTSTRCAPRSRPRSTPRPSEALSAPMPDPSDVLDGRLRARARPSRSATDRRRGADSRRRGGVMATLTYLQAISSRAARRAARRRARAPHGRGHRRLRRRLQGHRRLLRRVRSRPRNGHAAGRVGDHRHRDRRRRRRHATGVRDAVLGLHLLRL